MIWYLIRSILFLLPAEMAHEVATRLLIGVGGLCPFLLSWISGPQPKLAAIKAGGIYFKSPVGLAAGFDKNARLLPFLHRLGFGFAEIGTVTLNPQSGNAKPRLFRLKEERSLFNRMGFNNDGAKVVSQRVARCFHQLPEYFCVGLNIGINKGVSAEDAPSHFHEVCKEFRNLAHYVVVNVSSPNTPGLRELQTKENLKMILESVRDELSRWSQITPLFVKFAPEIGGEELKDLIGFLEQKRLVEGLVLTNTLAEEHFGVTGGVSGQELRELSLQRLREARPATKLSIISVGGVMNGEDARQRFESGAELVQIYSGWVYSGPRIVQDINRAYKSI